MRSWRRRLWVTGVGFVACLIILVGVLIGVFRIAVQLVPDYRAEVEQRVAVLLKSPVQIGGMDLIWRGRYPTLQLTQVAVGPDVASGLQLAELHIGFSLLRLVHGDWFPARITLSGTALQLSLEHGQLQLGGVQSDGRSKEPPEAFLDQLRRIGDVQLDDVRLTWIDRDHGRPSRQFQVDEGRISSNFRGMELSVNLTEIDRLDSHVQAEVSLRQSPWRVQSLQADIQYLDVWEDLHAFFPSMPLLQGQVRTLQVESRWDDTQWLDAQLRFDLAQLGPAAQVGAEAISRWSGELLLNALDDGVRGELRSDTLVASSGAWPAQLLTFSWQPPISAPTSTMATPASPDEYVDEPILDVVPAVAVVAEMPALGRFDLSAQYLRLQDFTPWASLLPDAIWQQWHALQPQGEVRQLLVQSAAAGQLPRLSAELADVQIQAHEGIPGFRQLSGLLSLDHDNGRLQINSPGFELHAPHLFEKSLRLDQFSGNLRWNRTAAGWQLDTPGLHYAAMGLDGVGRLNVQLDASPIVDLELNFFCADAAPWLTYQPLIWSKNLREWIGQAVPQGRVAAGVVQIKGALADFPYKQGKTGLFRVALDLADTQLKFAADWPQVQISTAQLLIEGETLTVNARDAKLGGLSAMQAHAVIPDLSQGDLEISAQIRGDAADAWKMLRASNLRKTIPGVLEGLAVSGRTDADLTLKLPLHDLQQVDYDVLARLDRAALWTRYWSDPVQKIRGEVRINREGLRGRNITAVIADLPVQVNLQPLNGVTRIDASMSVDPRNLPASVPVPKWLRERASGSSDWRMEMEIGPNADPNLLFVSNLLGTAWDLPSGLGKAADDLRKLSVTVTPADLTRIHINYGQILGFDALLAKGGRGLRSARVNLGGDVLPAEAPGWWMEGRLARADFERWLPLIQELTTELATSSAANTSAANAEGGFGGLLLRVDTLHALGQHLPDVRLQLSQAPDGWLLDLSSPLAEGRLRFPQGTAEQAGQRLQVVAEFERLNWSQANDAAAAPATDASYIDPRNLPALSLRVKNFAVNDVSLGTLDMLWSATSRGIRLEHLFVDTEKRREIDLSGLWLRDDAGSSAALDFTVDTRSFSSWLTVLGYQDNLVAKRGNLNGQFNWSANAAGLMTSNLSGQMKFDFSKGQLLNIEPGAGRMLGLFSFNALPRRFFLDFDDVVDTGLGFDQLSGQFVLKDGIAHTDDLEVKGPSLRIAARGDVDLSARTYDQIITIYPGLSSGVSIAATVLGGPVVGLFLIFAQELLDKPLDQVTQISYRLGGTWDNPQVSRQP